jgi:hypothetical protein
VDVRTVRLPAAPPVPPERMAAFQAVAQERSLLLAQVPPAGADTVLAD